MSLLTVFILGEIHLLVSIAMLIKGLLSIVILIQDKKAAYARQFYT